VRSPCPTVVTQELPIAPDDLVISRPGGAVVLKDPATGRFFRFGEAEHFIHEPARRHHSDRSGPQRAGRSSGSLPEPGMVKGSSSRSSGSGCSRPTTLRRTVRRPAPTDSVGRPTVPEVQRLRSDRLLDRLSTRSPSAYTRPSSCSPPAVIVLGFGIAVGGMGDITET